MLELYQTDRRFKNHNMVNVLTNTEQNKFYVEPILGEYVKSLLYRNDVAREIIPPENEIDPFHPEATLDEKRLIKFHDYIIVENKELHFFEKELFTTYNMHIPTLERKYHELQKIIKETK